MKNLYVYISFIFLSVFITPFVILGQSLSTDKNAVVHSKLRVATTNDADASDPTKAAINIKYIDGLGRPLQTIGYKQSPTQNDIITEAVNYDKYGRAYQAVLPAPVVTGTGAYQTNPISTAQSFYSDTYPYKQTTVYDNSPLNRAREQYGEGQAWRSASKNTKVSNESAGIDVRYYYLDANNNIVLNGFFPANSIFKTRMVDEQGHTVISYNDLQGRLVQKQTQDATGYITTYYIYDGSSRIKAIIQPEGYELNQSINYNSTEWDQWVFFYVYDYRSQLIEKKVPGAGVEYFVYDKWDRLVWTQTALQREQSKWTFKKYDAYNRLIMSGEKTESKTREQLQIEANNWTGDRFESRVTGGDIYYSYSNAYPLVFDTNEIREVFYFSFYDNWRPNDMLFDGANAYHAMHISSTGFATGGRTRNSENGNWLVYVNYYDNKNRIIQTYSHNLYGYIERTDFKYNFAGEAIEIRYLLRDVNNAATIQLERFDYDHTGRKTAYKLGMNAVGETIATYEYDEIGRMKVKKIYPDQTFSTGGAQDYINRPPSPGTNTNDVARKAINLDEGTVIDAVTVTKYSATIDPNAAGGTNIQGLQTIDYSCHIRGGLKGINLDGTGNPTPDAIQGDLFSYKLDYESGGFYDGNISKQTWQIVQNNSAVGLRSYTYTYDPVSRLKSATYAGINGEDYSLPNLSYDKNGNITNLQRKGKNSSSFSDIDNLNYTYAGNRLLGVTDAINGNEDVGDFRDEGSSNDYTYWNDGSLKSDANKGVTQILYDGYLKKIKQIDFSNGDWVKLFYNGNGTLLRRTNSLEEIWDYTSKGIYKNSSLYQFSQNEGRVVWNGNAYNYEFEYRDVWNNLRVNFKNENGQLVTTQTADYDMLGFELKTGQNGSNNFRFQQQERLFDFGLNWDLFKFRPSDSQIGRFLQIDPLAEKYAYNSVYALQENKFGLGLELEGTELIQFKTYEVLKNFFMSGVNSAIQSFQNDPGNVKERKVIRENMGAALAVKTARDATFNIVTTIRSEMGENTRLDPFSDNVGNAIQHTFWMALSTSFLGKEKAKEFGDAHESFQPAQLEAGLEMDKANNEVGYEIGSKFSFRTPNSVILNAIIQAGEQGKLTIVENGETVRTTISSEEAQVLRKVLLQMQTNEKAIADKKNNMLPK